MERLPGAIFKQHNARLYSKDVTRLFTYCYYPSLACLIPRFVSNRVYLGSFGTASWASSSLNELEARLQQKKKDELSQDIMQNLYTSMPDHIASCIRAKKSSTGY
ncbi:uncharacterized protein TNCV_1014801 [Trichonephila clavipes]|uniref:Uncharacterized protein n=1 Tax=Trichonephila clavipes TaxID=2585209 RepID=A0A8X6VXW7_TRICX|nr:uncharacterized protein TNCV_1014801 [Trichonephila clavipes]